MNIVQDINNIKKRLDTLISIISRNKEYTEYDIKSCNDNISKVNEAADDANELGLENTESIISAEQEITDMDLQIIETEQMITDVDLRLMTLEG